MAGRRPPTCHADGSSPVTVLATAEGSSRMTADPRILGVRSADVPYDDYEQKLRTHIPQLNEALRPGRQTPEQAVFLRCERMPALILVGFSSTRRHDRLPHGRQVVGRPAARGPAEALG